MGLVVNTAVYSDVSIIYENKFVDHKPESIREEVYAKL